MLDGEQLVKMFTDLVGMEKNYAEKLKILADRIKHPVIKVLLLGIANDSDKHAQFYTALIELLTRYQPTLSQEEFKTLSQEIAKHVETEMKMMEVTRELLAKLNDSRAKLLIAAIHEDEVKHHKLLTSIRDNISSEYVVSEEDMWNAIWRDSPWRGTPGG